MLGTIALAAILVYTLAYLVLWPIVLYFWDPKGVRKYPNFSPLSGITGFRHCYLAAQGFRSKHLYEEHARRGEPVLRIDPNSLSFCDTRAIKGIYGHGTKCLKDHSYVVLAGSHRQLFDVVDKNEHSRKRRLLSAAFAIKHLEKWEYKVTYTAERLFKAFDAKCTPPLTASVPDPDDLNLDFGHWINLWTIEAINYICLSSEMDLLDTGTDGVTAERRDGTMYRGRYRFSMNQNAWAQAVLVWDYKLWPLVKRLSQIIPSQYQTKWKNGEPWDDIIYHQAASRLRRHQDGEKLDDFFSCLMHDKDGEPNNLEWGEIVAEIALEHLIKHPQYMKALREEIDAVMGPDEVIASYEKVKHLPYLRAVIDESLALSRPPQLACPVERRPRDRASSTSGSLAIQV
ncbi:hypothetical protein PFICI_01689 [Pestalotiopsis fici W106-1]|uniref:Uncharacterized protein n=1 Tax=Pestalotiopsis fici (strain W106-1 / CGMCC3.15140) TaxID=1229662 RepID=W3XRL6_PESFW|nr:uncharacterized protein PFICI_01689 [Pestalotiopsis fici W106-1]ETS87861.1 hypothetical protein PFICI_01689 [Pestalotiopsis fici W106-1]